MHCVDQLDNQVSRPALNAEAFLKKSEQLAYANYSGTDYGI